MLDPFSLRPYGGGAKLPQPTPGVQDWGRGGEASDAANATMAITFFIFFISMNSCLRSVSDRIEQSSANCRGDGVSLPPAPSRVQLTRSRFGVQRSTAACL